MALDVLAGKRGKFEEEIKQYEEKSAKLTLEIERLEHSKATLDKDHLAKQKELEAILNLLKQTEGKIKDAEAKAFAAFSQMEDEPKSISELELGEKKTPL